MKPIILHNPRCSKSRQTLELLVQNGHDPEIRLYLEDAPTQAEILTILNYLDRDAPAIIRNKESLFKELGLSTKDQRTRDQWAEILAKNPKLIERPIVIYGKKAAIGRPPEQVLSLFD